MNSQGSRSNSAANFSDGQALQPLVRGVPTARPVAPDFFTTVPTRATMILHPGTVTTTASAPMLNVVFNGLGGTDRPQRSEPATED